MTHRLILFFIFAAFMESAIAQTAGFPDRKSALHALEQAERTIGNPLSAEHDEVAYLNTLKSVCSSAVLSESDKLRPKVLLADALKNQIGSKASDIEYVTPSSDAPQHIYGSHAPLTLIYFNDPDCEACEIVKSRLDTCTVLKGMVEDRKLQIIGIYTQNNEGLWRAAKFPSYIINGWDKNQQIENSETYTLPTLPLFYLLDADKKVLLKAEASLNKVIGYLLTESIK